MICHCVDKYDSLDYPILIADIDFGSSTTRRANTLSLSLETIIENASAGSCISFERLHLEQSANQWRKKSVFDINLERRTIKGEFPG